MNSFKLILLVACGFMSWKPAAAYTHYTARSVNSGEYVKSSDYAATGKMYGYVQDEEGGVLEYGLAGGRTWALWNGDDGYVYKYEHSDVYAKSDLAAGELKVRSAMSIGGVLPGSAHKQNYGEDAHSISASASFADTFVFKDGVGSPYLWKNGDNFTFSINIDGAIDLPDGHLAPRGYEDAAHTETVVSVAIYKAGQGFSALEALTKYVNNYSDAEDFWTEAARLGAKVGEAALGGRSWIVGDHLSYPGNLPYYELAPLVNGQALLEYELTLGQDFEFIISIETTARIDESYENMSVKLDFSNTLRAGFAAPDDAIILSASGTFPGTAPLASVPEPETYALMLTGLAIVGAARARRR